jgi:hypothetical protein
MLPAPEVIRHAEGKARPLPIEPWVAANLSRLWQSMKKHIEQTTVPTASDTQAQPRTDQSKPASARNRS